ncbi:MAG: hypothetical protein WC915_03875 [archaeon]|jgi:hypothetical protein
MIKRGSNLLSESFRGRISKIGFAWSRRSPKEIDAGKELHIIPKTLIYSEVAKQIVHQNPKLIERFLNLKRQISSGQEAFHGKLKVKDISHSVKGSTASRFYKLSIENKIFFVKEIIRGRKGPKFYAGYDSPERQIEASMRAKQVLKSNPSFGEFEVVNNHLAFSGKDNLFVVEDFISGINVLDIKSSPELFRKYHSQIEIFDFKFNRLADLLKSDKVGDFTAQNVMLVPETGKFMISDLRLDN